MGGDVVIGILTTEEPKVTRPVGSVVGFEFCELYRSEFSIAIFATLSLFNADLHTIAEDIRGLELDDLADPEAGSIDGEENGAMLQIADTAQKSMHFLDTEDLRKSLLSTTCRQVEALVVPLQETVIEAAHGSEGDVAAAVGQSTIFNKVYEVGLDLFVGQQVGGSVVAAGQPCDAPDVSCQGIFGQTP
jgi:hypothetical protein